MPEITINEDGIIEFNIKCYMKARWVNQFCSFLKQMEKNGNTGNSEIISFMSDGDGDFRPKFEISCDFEQETPYREKYETKSSLYDAG